MHDFMLRRVFAIRSRVAYSLADWICKAEENGSIILPIPSSDWSDGIIVAQLYQATKIGGVLTENGDP